jgi:sec-independent protein translocase protein TatA
LAAVGSGLVSPWHIAIFVLVVLLVFGPKKLPEIGRSLGRGMREFKDSITHDHPTAEEPPPVPRALPSGERSRQEHDTI